MAWREGGGDNCRPTMARSTKSSQRTACYTVLHSQSVTKSVSRITCAQRGAQRNLARSYVSCRAARFAAATSPHPTSHNPQPNHRLTTPPHLRPTQHHRPSRMPRNPKHATSLSRRTPPPATRTTAQHVPPPLPPPNWRPPHPCAATHTRCHDSPCEPAPPPIPRAPCRPPAPHRAHRAPSPPAHYINPRPTAVRPAPFAV